MGRTFRRPKGPDITFQFVKGVSGPPLPDVDREMRQTIQDERIRRQKIAQIRASRKSKGMR
jgi:hypothetical protein